MAAVVSSLRIRSYKTSAWHAQHEARQQQVSNDFFGHICLARATTPPKICGNATLKAQAETKSIISQVLIAFAASIPSVI
jgi:hypothetical protein